MTVVLGSVLGLIGGVALVAADAYRRDRSHRKDVLRRWDQAQ